MKKATNAWDYSQQAQYYRYRPNYAPQAIDDLIKLVGAVRTPNYRVADIGAGTANLTLMLLERGMHCVAVEPNAAMREIGKERTKGMDVVWMDGTGEHTGLESESVHWFVMGSSFNTTDRAATLREANRVLVPGGFFTCMWNHRDLENDPVQRRVEEIIVEAVPRYNRGSRREDQTEVIRASRLFGKIHATEHAQEVHQPLRRYLAAWKSVKNSYWDLETAAGRRIFQRIFDAITAEFGQNEMLMMRYVTRAWTAQKI